jgi:hypothetical protein
MKEEPKKTKSLFGNLIASVKDRIPSSKKEDKQPDYEFFWFKLVPIPETEGKDQPTFNIESADYVQEKLQSRPDPSFLEIYLTRAAMQRLESEIELERDPQSLIETINQRLGSDIDESGIDESGGVASPRKKPLRVRFHPKGWDITPALQNIYDRAFIVRPIYPPQVYIPPDESQIPSEVDQYLIGSFLVEDERGKALNGEDGTPIRVVTAGATEPASGLLRLYAHFDFDLLHKAFPDEPFSSYPLGLNLSCLIDLTSDEERKVSQVDLDLRDTKLLALISRQDEEVNLTYTLIEGKNKEIDILDYNGNSYPVDLKKESEIKKFYPVASDLRVPIVGLIGFRVELRFRDTQEVMRTKRYTFLFRFFKYALRFSAGKNWMASTGQFVREQGETVVMLPPAQIDKVKERQSPAFVLSPVSGGGPTSFVVSKHQDSALKLTIGDREIGMEPVPVDLANKPVILGKAPGAQDSRPEDFVFTLRDLQSLSAERREVARRWQDRKYAGFVDITCTPPRRISLRANEIVLGPGRFLDYNIRVNPRAVAIRRKYVSWELQPRKEEGILYYSTSRGTVQQPVQELPETYALGLMGTYFFYLDDFEFQIFLESTPRTVNLRLS